MEGGPAGLRLRGQVGAAALLADGLEVLLGVVPADLGLPQGLGQGGVRLLLGVQQGLEVGNLPPVPPVTGGLHQGEEQHQQPQDPRPQGQEEQGDFRKVQGKPRQPGEEIQGRPRHGEQNHQGDEGRHQPPAAGQGPAGVLDLLGDLLGLPVHLLGLGLLLGLKGLQVELGGVQLGGGLGIALLADGLELVGLRRQPLVPVVGLAAQGGRPGLLLGQVLAQGGGLGDGLAELGGLGLQQGDAAALVEAAAVEPGF